MKITRAIDVGYGNTKYTTSDGSTGDDIECQMFPSVAPITVRGIEEFLNKKNTVVIESSPGSLHEVGPDAMMGMTSNSSRTLDVDFATKDTYLALVRGALHYMNVDRIDYLVVGLPVKNMAAMSKILVDRLQGDHQLPNRTLNIGVVKVVPQPVGGMYDYGVRNNVLRQLSNGTNLLIDPGYFTLDWVVANGTKMVDVRSGSANNSGMAAILRSIIEKVSATIKARNEGIVDITEAIL